MKVMQINVTCGAGSTGKICVSISKLLTQNKIENYILFSSGESDYPLGIKYTNNCYIKVQALKSRIFGCYGFNSNHATKKIINELKRIKPDIVHLHNLHGHNCNLEMLFSYLKNEKIKIFWTFHDCWAFTAYCPHFTAIKCDKWKACCECCPLRKQFSWFADRSKWLFEKKKELFSGLDMTIVTPSQWLEDLVKESFLKGYPVKVINNGIDLSVFKPTESDFRQKHGIGDKYMLLGVADSWGERKGLDVFIELSKRLDSTKYQIVLVGTNDSMDKQLPDNIISVHRTQNQQELAEIYTAADLFVNPTREEVLGLVNIESLACGTPVVTFNTGGSPECVDESCGVVVECDDIDALEKEITRIAEEKPFPVENCLLRARQFDQNERFKEYIDLYQNKGEC